MEITKHRLTVPAQSWSLEEIRGFCKRTLKSSSIDQQVYRQLVLAVDEVAANVVEHAYPEGVKRGDITLDIDIQEQRITIEISDTGVPFNPLATEPVDPKKSFSSRRRRGYGIPIIRRIVEDIHYERTDDGTNVLRMTKLR